MKASLTRADHDEPAFLYGTEQFQKAQVAFAVDGAGAEDRDRLTAFDRGDGLHFSFEFGLLIDVVGLEGVCFIGRRACDMAVDTPGRQCTTRSQPCSRAAARTFNVPPTFTSQYSWAEFATLRNAAAMW